MYCSHCGVRATVETKFCEECGTTITQSNNAEVVKSSPAKIAGEYYPWRRFLARTLDIMVIGTLLLIGFVLLIALFFPRNIEGFISLLENTILAGSFAYLLWLPVEGVCLATFGTTPGKWLLGIRVLSKDGTKLTYLTALQRTLLVWVQGDAAGIPILILLTRVFAHKRLLATGTTLWDAKLGSVVVHQEWGKIRQLLTFLVAVAILLAIKFYSFIDAVEQ